MEESGREKAWMERNWGGSERRDTGSTGAV